MHPIVTVLQLGERTLPIGSYGVMLALAITLGAGLALRAAVARGMESGAVIASLGSAVAGGFVGAWALHALVEALRLGDLLLALQRPGLVFFGGAAGGVLALAFACRRLGLSAPALLDACVPAFALAHAVGRIGCFLGGCCHGGPAPAGYGVLYEHPLSPAAALGVPLHPVPLYEAMGLVLLALAFVRVGELGRAQPGRRALAYASGYCVLRLSLETLRGDAVRGLLPSPWPAVLPDVVLSTSQLIALLLLPACAALWRRRPAALA